MARTRIMWIEAKSGTDGLRGPVRIGRVTFSNTGKSLHYAGKTFHTLAGSGFKANYYDVETGDKYWISGCRGDGRDALYHTEATIDDDVLEEYWLEVRGMPENVARRTLVVDGKY